MATLDDDPALELASVNPAWSTVLVARIALRAVPILLTKPYPDNFDPHVLVRLMRATLEMWTTAAYGESKVRWDSERERHLVRMWKAGFTASQIAETLGSVSRNAVIGKAHRLGLESRKAEMAEDGGNAALPFPPIHEFAVEFTAPFQVHAAYTVSLARWVTYIASSQDQEVAQQHIGDVWKAAVEAARAYPASDREIMDSVQQAALVEDVHALNLGLQPARLARSRLWPSDAGPAAVLEFPKGPDELWDFWQQWFTSRLEGVSTLDLSPVRAASFDRELVTIPSFVWGGELAEVHEHIRKIISKYKDQEIIESLDDLKQADTDQLAAQNPVALQFSVRSDQKIHVDVSAGQKNVGRDRDTVDRHFEVLSSVRDLIALRTANGVGANYTTYLLNDAERLAAALGSSPDETRPGLLIPRGERLRRALAAQDQTDEIGANPPLPPPFASALAVLVGAYNVFVAFDAELARHDEAQLPPEARGNLVPPQMGQNLIETAVNEGVASPEARAVLAEEGALAPAVPDIENRSSRRYSEGIKNFGRAAVALAVKSVRWAWTHKKTVGGGAAGVASVATWVATHQVLLTEVFASSPTMVNIIREIGRLVSLLG